MQLLEILARIPSGYHRQANRQAERTNQTLQQYLRVHARESPDWPAALMTEEMAINNAPLEGTKYSPYELNLGYHPCLAPDTFWETRPNAGQSSTAKAWMKRMHEDWQRARAALVALNTTTTARANNHRQQSLFKAGDLVMVRMFPVN